MSCLIDTHCHLDNQSFESDLEDVIRRAMSKDVKKIIIPAADPKDLPRAIKIAEKYTHIYFAVGIHPDEAKDANLKEISQYIHHPKCVAIGECGLDYYRLPQSQSEREEYKEIQKQVFKEHIELAIEVNKPLIVHIREASFDAFEILKNYKEIRGVLHCFNADEILLGLSDRFYYGIGGVSTFKNAKRVVEILPRIPKDKILLETDAPYLTPHPHRGERNEPMYIPLIVQKLSEVLGISESEIGVLSTQNAFDLFGEI